MELLKAMAKRTDVPRSKLVQRALTMLFNEHAMEVRRAEGGPMWLAPVKPRTVPEPAEDEREAMLTEHPERRTPFDAPTELPGPPTVPSDTVPDADPPRAAQPHMAPVANGGPPRPSPFFPPRQKSVTLE